MTISKQLDVLSIGDVVSDAFIKLLDDKAWTEERDGQQVLVMPFATKIPYEGTIFVEGVGNAANAAVSFARLGLNVGFVTNVGDDKYGRGVIAALSGNKVDTRWVRVNPNKGTNYHYVLWYKEERTILIKHEQYEYSWPNLRAQEVPRWVYFSSIAENSLEYHDEVADWLDDNPEVKMAFQPGTYQMKFGTERLKRIYKHANILVLNREEAAMVSGGNRDDLHDLFNRLHELGPEIICITDGPKGAYASSADGRWFMPIYPDIAPPLERTGAGDAFTSTFTASLIHGMSVEDALKWAPINSMNVVQHVGAQAGLLTQKQLNEYLEKAPDWYHPERM